MTDKDKKIIEDAERDNIPIFVLTAKDMVTPDTITDYMDRCSEAGCSDEHTNTVNNRITEFQDWQEANSEKVKLAD